MKFKTSLLVAASIAALSATTAVAGPLDEAKFSFGYDSYQSDDHGDTDGTWLRGDTAVEFGKVKTDIGFAIDGLTGDFDKEYTLSVAPKFEVNDKFTAGAFLDYSFSDDDADSKSMHYGVEGAYKHDALTLAGYAGFGDYSSDGAADVETDVFGVSAGYDLKNGLDFTGFYDIEKADGFDVSQVGVGIGYDLAKFDIPAYVNGSIAKVDSDGVDSTKVSLGLSIPFGKGSAGKGPLNKGHSMF